jgi:hypothetical protein
MSIEKPYTLRKFGTAFALSCGGLLFSACGIEIIDTDQITSVDQPTTPANHYNLDNSSREHIIEEACDSVTAELQGKKSAAVQATELSDLKSRYDQLQGAFPTPTDGQYTHDSFEQTLTQQCPAYADTTR